MKMRGVKIFYFLGMASLLQIGVHDYTYLIDPFPLYDKIVTEFKSILESSNYTKLMHGCANDAMSLKRDFSVSIAGVIDLQLVHREMMRAFLNSVYSQDLSQCYDADGLIERATGVLKGRYPNNEDFKNLQQLSSDGIGLSRLVKLYFPGSKDPVDATLADWRIRPLINNDMIDYAVYDVHSLYYIWQHMKKLVHKKTNILLLI